MTKYGDTALKAIELIHDEKLNPREAWEKAILDSFNEGSSGAVKGCPKETFLGLCMEGKIKGVPPGPYTTSVQNKAYGLAAIKLLKKNPEFIKNKTKLWIKIREISNAPQSQNNQLDVVLALWEELLIVP